jgi:hypothetical protein
MNAIGKPLQIGQYFSKSFKIFGAYPWQYIGIIALTFVFGAFTNLLPVTSLLFNFFMLQPLINGIYFFTYNQLKSEPPLFMDFFGVFQRKKYIPVVLISIGTQVLYNALLILSAIIVFQSEFSAGEIASFAFDQLYSQLFGGTQTGYYEHQQHFLETHAWQLVSMFGLFLILFIPVFYLSWYTSIAVVLKDVSLPSAIRSGINLFRAKAFSIVRLVTLSYFTVLSGFLLCLVGLMVALPILQITWCLAFMDMEEEGSLSSE